MVNITQNIAIFAYFIVHFYFFILFYAVHIFFI